MISENDFRFWHLIGSMRIRTLFWPEGIWGIVLGLISGILINHYTAIGTRYEISGDYLVISSVLLGVVFATLALVISLLSDSYLVFLNSTGRGFIPFMAPFVVGVAIQAIALVSAILHRILVLNSCHTSESIVFTVTTTLFLYALFDVVSLAKKVVAHAITRAEYLSAIGVRHKEI